MSDHPARCLETTPVSSPAPEEIIAARKAVGITQTRAGEIIHSSLRGWQQWEAGDRRMHPAMWELFLIKTNGDNGRCLNVVQRAALNAALKYAEKIAPDAFPDQQAVDDFLSNIMETPTNDTNVIDKLTQHHFIRAITIMGMEIVSGNNCRIAAANKTKGC